MPRDILTGASDRLASQIYQTFDLQLVYSKDQHQVSIRAVIRPSTPATLAAIIADSETPDPPPSPSPTRPDFRSWNPTPFAGNRP